jgi:integrase
MRTPGKKANGKWRIRFLDAHGVLRSASYSTKREAEAALLEKREALAAGLDPGRRVGFDELVKEWTASHLTHGLRPSTVKDYKQALSRMSDYFGQREVRRITAADLEKCRNEMVRLVVAERVAKFERVLARAIAVPEGDRSESDRSVIQREAAIRFTIQRGGIRAAAKVIGTARTLWKFAVSRASAPRNIAVDVKKPTAPALVESGVIDENILTPAEIELLIAKTDEVWRCAVRFLFMTGMRLGELAGLQWSDLDWTSRRVLVRRQRSGIDGELRAPKTRAGTRWIDLPAALVTELKAHRLATPGEYVFPIDERNFRSRVWHPALRRAGLRSIRIHDARHTHASLLIGSGADIVGVSRRLGHANPAITLSTYSHAFTRRDTAPLGEALATFMRKETGGLDLGSGDENGERRSA